MLIDQLLSMVGSLSPDAQTRIAKVILAEVGDSLVPKTWKVSFRHPGTNRDANGYSIGPGIIPAIKMARELASPDLGLKEAKDLIEASVVARMFLPRVCTSELEAEECTAKLRDSGCIEVRVERVRA